MPPVGVSSPPSAVIAVPEMYEARSLARKAMTRAISSGRPIRPNIDNLWQACTTRSGCSSSEAAQRSMGVSIAPGQTQLTRILSAAKSSAIERVNPSSACFTATQSAAALAFAGTPLSCYGDDRRRSGVGGEDDVTVWEQSAGGVTGTEYCRGATQRSLNIRAGSPGVRLRGVQSGLAVGSDDEGAPIEEAQSWAQFIIERRATQERERALGRAIGRTDARPLIRCGVVKLGIASSGGDAVVDIVGKDFAVGELGPAFFFAQVVIYLVRGGGKGITGDVVNV